MNSIFISLFIKICIVFKESLFYRTINSVLDRLSEDLKTSVFWKVLTKITFLESKKEDSLFCKAIQKTADVFIKITQKIYNFIKKLNTGSITEAVYKKVFADSFFLRYENMLAILISLVFVIPHQYWNNMYALIIAVFLAFFYVLSLAGGNRLGRNALKIWLPLLLFVFSIVYSVIISYNITDSIRIAVFFVTSFIFTLLIAGTLSSYERISKFTGAMYVAIFICGAFGIIQRFMGVEVDPALTDVTLNADMPGRVFSTLGNPNNFAEFLTMFMPFAFAYAINIKDKRIKAFALLLMALPVGSLLMTYSRSGWMAFAVSAIVFILLAKRKWVPAFIILCICAIPLLPQSIWARILTIGNINDSSSSYRIDIWTACLDMLKDYPVTGIGLGPGAFAKIYPDYSCARAVTAAHSHMQFLEILIETGIIGLISFLWLTVALIKRSVDKVIKTTCKKMKNMAAAGAASIAGISFIGLFEYCWFYPRVMFAFFIVAGITMAIAGREETL